LHIEKRGMSTPALLSRLGERFRLHERDIGVAGMKDQRGVTRQWISVPARAVEPELAAVESLGVKLLASARHGNKLRMGHLRGNRFTLVLQGDVDVDWLNDRALRMAAGVPNYFGAQRFGHDNRTVREAERFLQHPRPARSRREKMWVSAVQSSLFNAWLSERITDGLLFMAVDGDILLKAENGAPFTCTDATVDTARVQAGEVLPSGPLPGARVRRPDRDALTRESRIFEALGVDEAGLHAHPAFDNGARRAAILRPTELEATAIEGGARVQFALGSGSYATVLLREWVGGRLQDAAFEAPES
jgi:tRNA pseudouridine13 synthase